MKLVAICVVLRGEDSTWIDADALNYTSGVGLVGYLTTSKTPRPGKKTKHREIVVSEGAYVAETDWLETGWKLWNSAPRPRQNFIALPDPTFEQFRDAGAEVQDRIALTRCLLEKMCLATNDPNQMGLNNRAARSWAEHSSLPSLPSWARALGVPKEVTDRMGYWGSGGAGSQLKLTSEIIEER